MVGIVTPEDAVEFLLTGATAIQVGTASYAAPGATERLAKGLESWCRTHNIEKGVRSDRSARNTARPSDDA
jgi:dihydroorotate dehydrogenase (NAD+) catalytic subunit